MSLWAVVPAAGVGSRMGAELPKQYLKHKDRTLIQYTVEALSKVSALQGIVIVHSSADEYISQISFSGSVAIFFVEGGATRSDSVLAGLQFVRQKDNDALALVHDAARPGVSAELCNQLLSSLKSDSEVCGAILALPAHDTVKECNVTNGPYITRTLPRERVFLAQTPQLFPVGPLIEALQLCRQQHYNVTDEASAMEYCGHRVNVVNGSIFNFKITTQEDWALWKSLN